MSDTMVRSRIASLDLPPGLLSVDELAHLTASIARAESLWRPLVHHDACTRWYARLYLARDVEVWLIGWAADQDTRLHDHGGSSGAFTVCEGRLVEDHTVRTRMGPLRRRVRRAGTTRRLGPACLHDLGNAGPGVATSVHAYSPPLSMMSFYDAGPGGRLVRVESRLVGGPDPMTT